MMQCSMRGTAVFPEYTVFAVALKWDIVPFSRQHSCNTCSTVCMFSTYTIPVEKCCIQFSQCSLKDICSIEELCYVYKCQPVCRTEEIPVKKQCCCEEKMLFEKYTAIRFPWKNSSPSLVDFWEGHDLLFFSPSEDKIRIWIDFAQSTSKTKRLNLGFRKFQVNHPMCYFT